MNEEPESADDKSGGGEPNSKGVSKIRIAVLIGVLVGTFILAKATGVTERLSLEAIRDYIEGAGAIGFVVFLAVFAIGELVHVPGTIFVAAAVLAYGRLLGGVVGYAGALLSVVVSFYVVRKIGGQPLAAIEKPWVVKIFQKLEDEPVRWTAILRLVFWMLPALNYGLAMSPIRARDYIVGSALGLIIPIALASFFIDLVLSFLQ